MQYQYILVLLLLLLNNLRSQSFEGDWYASSPYYNIHLHIYKVKNTLKARLDFQNSDIKELNIKGNFTLNRDSIFLNYLLLDNPFTLLGVINHDSIFAIAKNKTWNYQFALLFIKENHPTTFEQSKIFELKKSFTKSDSLRGINSRERSWWDLKHYRLEININPVNKYISGTNTISYVVLEPFQIMQIELEAPLEIDSIIYGNKNLNFTRSDISYFIELTDPQNKSALNSLIIYFHGKPKTSVNPPWSAGFVWTEDNNKNPFIGVACQDPGASVWWPCKDQLYDKVDSCDLIFTVPKPVQAISNGQLISSSETNDNKIFHWKVVSPINAYGISINIADYKHWSSTYAGLKGNLKLDYYTLAEHYDIARKQFNQVDSMLHAFEYWFGPYPFYNDGYKIVETPYLGMEHQSAIAYGNNFRNGFLSMDLSQTNWGLKFDYIIIHESAHEWFANGVAIQDNADLWIPEGFATYAEACYLEYYYGKKAAEDYLIGLRKNISNRFTINKIKNVNYSQEDQDAYSKGANFIHTLRCLLHNDSLWLCLLHDFTKTYKYKTITECEVKNLFQKYYSIDLMPIFDQYLRSTQIPTIEIITKKRQIQYRWINCHGDFNMPLLIHINGKEHWIFPGANWTIENLNIKVRRTNISNGFYIGQMKY